MNIPVIRGPALDALHFFSSLKSYIALINMTLVLGQAAHQARAGSLVMMAGG